VISLFGRPIVSWLRRQSLVKLYKQCRQKTRSQYQKPKQEETKHLGRSSFPPSSPSVHSLRIIPPHFETGERNALLIALTYVPGGVVAQPKTLVGNWRRIYHKQRPDAPIRRVPSRDPLAPHPSHRQRFVSCPAPCSLQERTPL
jgi:hypothetical protein